MRRGSIRNAYTHSIQGTSRNTTVTRPRIIQTTYSTTPIILFQETSPCSPSNAFFSLSPMSNFYISVLTLHLDNLVFTPVIFIALFFTSHLFLAKYVIFIASSLFPPSRPSAIKINHQHHTQGTYEPISRNQCLLYVKVLICGTWQTQPNSFIQRSFLIK